MSLSIYMYNTWFGDCFRIENNSSIENNDSIENNGSNLWVDFGIHRQSIMPKGLTRDDIHKIIAVDILSSHNPSLLISHFHEDHVSGLLFMMKHLVKYKGPIFEKVYIPDIWNIKDAPVIIAVLLLEELLKHARLNVGRGSVTLFELVRFLCANKGYVVPIKRGLHIEGKQYIALWPDPHCVSTYAKDYLKSLEIGNIPTSILNIAERLHALVLECIEMNDTNVSTENLLSRLNSLESDFLGLMDDSEVITVLEKLGYIDDDINLNHMGNNISIVFQNTEFVQGETLLFTGDLENKFLVKIANNYDKKLSMHSYFDFVKVPHHGTRGSRGEHYFDFKPYNPRVFMIPNGCANVRGNWRICNNYSIDIKLIGSEAFCSNSNFCNSNPGSRFSTCSCVDRQIVFPTMSGKLVQI